MRESAPPNAAALIDFVGMTALALHIGALRPAEQDKTQVDQILRRRVDWSDEAFQLVLGADAESHIRTCLQERLLPDWRRAAQQFTAMVPGLIDLPLDRFLPWLLEAEASVYDALQDLGNNLDIPASLERQLLEELQRMRPDLAERLRVSGPSLVYKDRIEAHPDFKLLADVCREAAAMAKRASWPRPSLAIESPLDLPPRLS